MTTRPSAASTWTLVKTDAAQLLSVEKTSGKDTYEITLGKAVNYGDGDHTKAKFDKVPTDVADMIGLNVKVLVKAKANGDTNVYGVYADDDSKVLASWYCWYSGHRKERVQEVQRLTALSTRLKGSG